MRNRAFSLIELIVTMGVFGLLTTLVVGLITMSGNWLRRTSAGQDSQQDLLVAANEISRAIGQAPADSVLVHYPSGTPTSGDLVLSFQTARDTAGNHCQDPNTFEPLYQGHRIYYLDPGTRKLMRTFLPQTPTATIAPATPADVMAILNPSDDKALAHQVDRFMVLNPNDDSPTDLVFNPLRMELEIGQSKRDQEVSLTTIRNVRLYR